MSAAANRNEPFLLQRLHVRCDLGDEIGIRERGLQWPEIEQFETRAAQDFQNALHLGAQLRKIGHPAIAGIVAVVHHLGAGLDIDLIRRRHLGEVAAKCFLLGVERDVEEIDADVVGGLEQRLALLAAEAEERCRPG